MENVNHPEHYGGADNPYETIKVIEAWGLDFCLGNTVKYISRAGKKDARKEIEDLEKARFYLTRRIDHLKSKSRLAEDHTAESNHAIAPKSCPYGRTSVELDCTYCKYAKENDEYIDCDLITNP